jgi:hypothetical protein
MTATISKSPTGSMVCIQTGIVSSAADRWKFSAPVRKQFLVRCGLLFLFMVAWRWDIYRQGLNLSTFSVFSLTFLLMAAFVIQFFRTLFSAGRMIRYQTSRRLPKWHLFILLLLPLTFVICQTIPAPGFSDGAARALRRLNISDQLVAVVAEDFSIPKENDEDPYGLPKKWSRISAKAPLTQLKFDHPDLKVLDETLIFEFGGPLTLNRWGIAVSGIKGKSPSIPPNRFNLRSASQEIVVFEESTD